jgi:hypothetical protein
MQNQANHRKPEEHARATGGRRYYLTRLPETHEAQDDNGQQFGYFHQVFFCLVVLEISTARFAEWSSCLLLGRFTPLTPANRARNGQDATVCRFKIRMAELEAASAAEVSAAIEKKQSAGPLPVDWLMTAAALNIRQGNLGEALRFLTDARNGNNPGLFASCVNDLFFRDECQKQPELAEACRGHDPRANTREATDEFLRRLSGKRPSGKEKQRCSP